MTSLNLPPIESLDVEDLLSLPEGYRYELREGNLVIMRPSTFWHKAMARRISPACCTRPASTRSRILECSEIGRGIAAFPISVSSTSCRRGMASYSNLPGSAYRLVVEIVSENSLNGEYTDKMDWYARRGIPEYWIVDQAPGRADDDALVQVYRLQQSDGMHAYALERRLLLSELEAEYRAKSKDL